MLSWYTFNVFFKGVKDFYKWEKCEGNVCFRWINICLSWGNMCLMHGLSNLMTYISNKNVN